HGARHAPPAARRSTWPTRRPPGHTRQECPSPSWAPPAPYAPFLQSVMEPAQVAAEPSRSEDQNPTRTLVCGGMARGRGARGEGGGGGTGGLAELADAGGQAADQVAQGEAGRH